jgi:S-formylglutathione hydrolase FrmB
MGGYGALRIGMKYPDVYSAIYAMSPCCLRTLDGGFDLSGTEHIATYEDFQHANFFAKAEMGLAVAWSPNLGSPPFFVDLPTKDGQVQPAVLAKWDANSPLAMVDQYIGNLRQLSAIGFDAGNRDLGNIADTVTVLDGTLTQYHVSHRFDIYSGTHTSGIAERWEKVVLPMLSAALGSTTAAPTRKTITH